MTIQTVNHIAEASFKNHFFNETEGQPVNGKIKIKKNTFYVTFDDGKVNARFTSGNFFTNAFRSKTLSRLTEKLQTQYNVWLEEQAIIKAKQAEEARITGGYKDNPNADKIAAVVEEFKAVLAKTNPPDLKELQNFLDEITKLAKLRNTLTRVVNGTDCDKEVSKAGFLIHTKDHTKGLDERGKKGYVLQTIDAVINGLVQVANQMTDKDKQVPEFMEVFSGACVEAKGENIQFWLAREAGLIRASRSDQSHDLAYSIIAEFKLTADSIREPYIKEARAACEAEIRADCASKNITNEEVIKDTIETKVQQILDTKEDEIKPKIRKALEDGGKFDLYEVLAGVKRPMTEITKDENTGVWTVTKLVDAQGKPIMKPVSAFDIDKNFSKMVDMFMEDAMVMGYVVEKTRTVEGITFASKADLKGADVVALAEKYASGEFGKAELATLVKAEIPFAAEIPDDKFDKFLEEAIGDIAAIKDDDPAKLKENFRTFAINYADGSYYDKTNDLDRLVHLLASRTATLADPEKKILANIEAMSAHCAQMMSNAYPDNKVFVITAKNHISRTLKSMVKTVFHSAEGNRFAAQAKQYLDILANNGIMFTDCIRFDLGHRAAGRNEVKLHKIFDVLFWSIKRFSGANQNWYMKTAKG